MSDHKVKLTDDQKREWFKSRIEERLSVSAIESEQQLIDLVRMLRRQFKELYQRDVPGSFIRRLLSDLGLAREHGEGVKKKRDYMFELMDKNKSFRENKTQTRKAVEAHFGEKILSMVFDELWDEYHSTEDHPKPEIDVDIHGQPALFPEGE